MIAQTAARRFLNVSRTNSIPRTGVPQRLFKTPHRLASSTSHPTPQKTGLAGETSYIAASAVFFTGLYFYLHSGNEPGKKSEHASHGFSTNVRDDNKAEPDDGLTAKLMYSSSDDSKATNEDVQDSTRKAISADAPNSAYGAEEGKSGSQPASDVKDSIARGFASDNPKTSYQAEKDQAGDGWVDVGTTDSIKKSLAADAPKTAKKVEEGRAVASTAR